MISEQQNVLSQNNSMYIKQDRIDRQSMIKYILWNDLKIKGNANMKLDVPCHALQWWIMMIMMALMRNERQNWFEK